VSRSADTRRWVGQRWTTPAGQCGDRDDDLAELGVGAVACKMATRRDLVTFSVRGGNRLRPSLEGLNDRPGQLGYIVASGTPLRQPWKDLPPDSNVARTHGT
jgi:hypothetical protein